MRVVVEGAADGAKGEESFVGEGMKALLEQVHVIMVSGFDYDILCSPHVLQDKELPGSR